MQQTALTPTKQSSFPFSLEDLKSWTIKRLDGTVTKYVVSKDATTNTPATTQSPKASLNSYSSYCAHTPTTTNHLASFKRQDGHDLKLWVGNMSGARATRDSFDFVIDAGDVVTIPRPADYLEGDEELKLALEEYVIAVPQVRVLKIDWNDREAPLVDPEFWVQLNKLIYGDVMTCCIGGHGRSGTSFACLLMVNAPDYNALDAIIHTRAVHCPRAIESIDQHNYIDSVARYLGREANAEKAHTVTDYKTAFMNSTKPTAIRTREELGWKSNA